MKKVLFLLLAVLTLASCTEEKVNVRWATFNMRYDNPGDAPNHWGARKERVAQYIKDTKIDVLSHAFLASSPMVGGIAWIIVTHVECSPTYIHFFFRAACHSNYGKQQKQYFSHFSYFLVANSLVNE